MSDALILDALLTLEKLSKTPGRKRKLRLELLSSQSPNPILEKIFRYTYDWRLSFPVLPAIELKENKYTRTPQQNWDEFEKIISILITRSLPGSQSRLLLRNFFKCTSKIESAIYLKVLQRDLHCGVSLRILSKAFKTFNLRFGYMRPAQVHGVLRKVPNPLASIPLLEGQRVILVVYQGCATAYTDGFRVVPILDELGRELVNVGTGNYVLDGTLTSEHWADSERLLNSKLKSISPMELRQFVTRLNFVANDRFSIDLFDGDIGKDETPFSSRRINLETLVQKVKNKNHKTAIKLGGMRIIRTSRELKQAYYHAKQIGYAGLSFQNYDGIYESGISQNMWATHLAKIKTQQRVKR